MQSAHVQPMFQSASLAKSATELEPPTIQLLSKRANIRGELCMGDRSIGIRSEIKRRRPHRRMKLSQYLQQHGAGSSVYECEDLLDYDEEDASPSYSSGPPLKVAHFGSYSAPLPPPGSATPSASSRPTDILSSLIAAQQADGSWQLSPALSQILSRTIQEVEQACPVGLKESPVVGVVWATVLVLAILEKKCKGQCDEWELIAMKANKWLKKQVLPGGAELSKFQESARAFV